MKYVIIVFLLVLFVSCNQEKVYAPKPRLYPKIDFPNRAYKPFQEDYCNFSFNMPAYGHVIKDSLFFEEKPLNPCWFDIVLPPFNGRLHFSYYPISSRAEYDKLVDDAFTFVEKHDIKANYRAENTISNKYDIGGIIFEIDGPVASPIQFFLTDTTTNFLRASLYFNNKVAPDSMKVVHEWVKEDVVQLISTFQFATSD